MDDSDPSIRLLLPQDDAEPPQPAQPRPTRGVAWVVRWAAAIGTLVTSAAVLIEFGYLLAAEQTLARAARAGTLEATLPRADYHSVEQAVRRRLEARGWPPSALRLSFEHNAIPVRRKFLARGGDRFTVNLAIPTAEVLPRWLRAVTLRPPGAEIQAHAERRMPGAQLR